MSSSPANRVKIEVERNCYIRFQYQRKIKVMTISLENFNLKRVNQK